MKLTSKKALEMLNDAKGKTITDLWITHSICVANTASVIAKELNLDVEYAKTLGYIHDYGKAVGDFSKHDMNGFNYLKDLANMFLVFAEDEAKQRHVMTMKDWINATDDLLKFRRKKVLNNSGSISHKEAVEKAEKEYEKFRVIQDQKYISSMDEFYNKYLNENKEEK